MEHLDNQLSQMNMGGATFESPHYGKPLEQLLELSSIDLKTVHGKVARPGCEYCKATRTILGDDGQEMVEKNLMYHIAGFTSYKMSSLDYEELANRGFSKCGNYFYQRDPHKSCCEAYQYRVDVDQFQPSHSQKKVMSRFLKYLHTGKMGKEEGKEEEKKEEGKESQEKAALQLSIIEQIRATIEQASGALGPNHKVVWNEKKKCVSSNVLLAVKNADEGLQGQVEAKVKALPCVKEAKAENKFVNIALKEEEEKVFAAEKKPKGQKQKKKKEEEKWVPPANYFKNYVKQFKEAGPPEGEKPAHVYTIEIHKAIFNEEMYQVYHKYEMAIHKKDRTREELKRYNCNSPVFDPSKEDILKFIPSPTSHLDFDNLLVFADEGIYPGLGTFHMYHRIDGKLVAVGLLDICTTLYNSDYFIYDPDYSFLHLGVVGALIEIEYMRLIQEKYLPTLKYYFLSEMVASCPKVNYKINYKPGLVTCPYTKQLVGYDQARPTLDLIASLPQNLKQEMPYLLVGDLDKSPELQEEQKQIEEMKKTLWSMPFFFSEVEWSRVCDCQGINKEKLVQSLSQLLEMMGPSLFKKFLFELKYNSAVF